MVIYPSPLKYGQALSLPYSELFRRLWQCHSSAAVSAIRHWIWFLVDEHVNAIIRQALAVPSFTLVVIDPIS